MTSFRGQTHRFPPGSVERAPPTQRALYEAVGVLGVVKDDADQTILDHPGALGWRMRGAWLGTSPAVI